MVPEAAVADVVLFLVGAALGWFIGMMDYVQGFENGWHQGVEDVIAIMEGEEIND